MLQIIPLRLSALLTLFAIAIPLSTSAGASPACTLDQATATTIDKRPFLLDGFGTRWNIPTNTIAFTKTDASGYYRIYTMQPDGSHLKKLTAAQPNFPPGHQGSVYWHPSGKYLLFTAQKRDWADTRMFGNQAYGSLPGFGRHDDMWLITADGRRCWQLTKDPEVPHQGVLMPVFSPDGKHIAWASSKPDKSYVLKIADFVQTPQPHLANIKSCQPGGPTYYETGSFSSDSKSLFYTSDQDTHSFWASQIYRLDIATGQSTRLTHGFAYNEHPTVVHTPTGDWVVYMSTKGVQRRPFHLMLGTDWYAMRPDGSALKRLTTMNLNDPDNPENMGEPLVACTVAISPAGTYMLGDVQDNLIKQTGRVLTVRFTP